MHRRPSSVFFRTAVPLLARAFSVSAQNSAAQNPATSLPGIGPAPALAPPPHEAFDYNIEWRLITAGKAHLEWNANPAAAADPAGSTAGNVHLHVESTGLVSRLFLVNDDYSANLASGFCAQNYLIQAQEGGRHKETRVNFDTAARKATYVEKDLTKNTTVSQDATLQSPCVHDLIGGLISLRYLRLDPGKTAMVPVSDGKKYVVAKVESQRREQLKTEFGLVNTVLYEVYLFDNVLFRRAGHLHIWFTDDERRIPIQLQVRLQIAIGTITFRMLKPTPGENSSVGK